MPEPQDTTDTTDAPTSEGPPETRLEELRAQATAKYAVKDYKAAAELYSRATELQAEINGEMSPKNANLLYFYGRCLYHLAVSNSDVLGTKVAGEDKESSSKKTKPASGVAESSKAPAKDAPAASGSSKEPAPPEDPKAPKPFFQFQGDENFDVSDDDEDEDGDDAAAPAADDDFADAFEVLDLARVLLERHLEEQKAQASSDEAAQKEVRALEERLADTFDLQAEISLENENFPQAATDMRAALALKESLYPFESSLIAEAHYKLSLALEFSAVTQQKDASGQPAEALPMVVDEKMRTEAATEMERAVGSCEARIAVEEAKANDTADETQAKKLRKETADVKDMVAEMKLRLVDLRKPLVSVNDLVGEDVEPAKGLLGNLQGQTLATQKAIVEEASKQANDLTGLVKRKRKDDADAPETADSGKRAKTEER